MSRGQPRTQYARTYCVIHESVSDEQAVEIFRQNWCAARRTCGGSFDDAGLGDLDQRTVLIYGVPIDQEQSNRDWYAENYPGTSVEFCEVPAVSQQQIVITSSVPMNECRVRYGTAVLPSGIYQLFLTPNETVRTTGFVPLTIEGQ